MWGWPTGKRCGFTLHPWHSPWVACGLRGPPSECMTHIAICTLWYQVYEVGPKGWTVYIIYSKRWNPSRGIPRATHAAENFPGICQASLFSKTDHVGLTHGTTVQIGLFHPRQGMRKPPGFAKWMITYCTCRCTRYLYYHGKSNNVSLAAALRATGGP